MRTWLRVAYTTGKRELYGYALSPIAYVLAALFLVVQGYSFWLLCGMLGASRSTLGAVLAYFFGGTFLYWLFLLFVVALLTMRLFAEERQRGALDLLLSAPVPEGALVAGKFLGALGFYLALWLPTLGYVALLGAYAGGMGALDPGPIAGGYLGTLLCGASALAIGVLASVLAPTALVSVALTFVSLCLLILGGLVFDPYVESPALQALLAYLNLFSHLDELARGIVDSRRVVYHLGLAATALFVAARLLRVRPGDRRGRLRGAAEALGALGLLVGLNLLAARHPLRLDLTRAGEYHLSPSLGQLCDRLRGGTTTVHVTVVHADPGVRDELFERLRETLLRVEQRAGGRLRVDWLDLDRHRERARLLGERYHIERDDLRQGLVVVDSDGHSKLIPRSALGELGPVEPGGAAPVTAYRGEEALGTALLTVLTGRTPTVCFTRGHGEAEHDSLTGSGLSELATAMTRDNLRTRALGTPAELAAIPADCDVVAIVGPERPFLPAEAAALDRYLDGGGRLLLLVGALIDKGLNRFLDTGLEELLKRRGIRLGQAVVVDPPQRLGDSLAFVIDSYGDHPITAGLMGRRTLWPLARPVFPLAAPQPAPDGTGHTGLAAHAWTLAATGPEGFGETDLGALREHNLRFDVAADLPGPVPVAVAAQPTDGPRPPRLVALGSTQLAWNDSLVLYNRDFVLASLRWLADVPLPVSIEPRRPTELRLTLTAEQGRRLFLLVVLGLPLLVLALGGGVRWLRRG